MKKNILTLFFSICTLILLVYFIKDESKPFRKFILRTSYKDKSDSIMITRANKYKVFKEKESLQESLPIIPSDVVFVGNSLTERFPVTEMFLNQKSVLNRGIASNSSFDILPRFKRICSHKPSKIFLMVGINDLSLSIPEEETFSNIESMLREVNRTETQLYLQSILPVDDVTKTRKIINYNKRLKSLCDKYKIVYVNLFDSFQNGTVIKPNLTTDGTHLTAEAYHIWKKLVEPHVLGV
jgi:lysophospholipase L1-like esterase